MIKNEPEPDFDDEYEEGMQEADEPDYWYCTCCNHTQGDRGMGGSCDRCGLFNVMEEGYF